MFAIAFMVGLKPFIGPAADTPNKPHEGPVLLWIGPLVLAVLGLGAGLFSQRGSCSRVQSRWRAPLPAHRSR